MYNVHIAIVALLQCMRAAYCNMFREMLYIHFTDQNMYCLARERLQYIDNIHTVPQAWPVLSYYLN